MDTKIVTVQSACDRAAIDLIEHCIAWGSSGTSESVLHIDEYGKPSAWVVSATRKDDSALLSKLTCQQAMLLKNNGWYPIDEGFETWTLTGGQAMPCDKALSFVVESVLKQSVDRLCEIMSLTGCGQHAMAEAIERLERTAKYVAAQREYT